jgi:cytochrome d ubiquinol oxidase subunit II
MPEAALVIILLGLTAYAVLGGADFGAGFWDLTAGGAQRGARVRGMIVRSMSPVWEANHVWLIFVLVFLWTSFPEAFGSIMSTLYVPMFLAVAGIIFRGAAFAVRGEASTIAESRTLGAIFALSSVIVPFCFGTVIGGIASGRVPAGNAEGDEWSSWINLTSIYIGVLCVATGAFVSAVYLAADALRGGFDDLVERFRVRALGAGVVTGILALAGLPVLNDDAPALQDGLTSMPGVLLVIVSALFGLATFALVWTRRFGLARLTAAGAVAAVVAGWAVAQSPDILPGSLTLDQAAAGDATLTAVLVAFGLAVVILGPALAYLYRLTLAGTLDKPFKPIVAGDEEAQR